MWPDILPPCEDGKHDWQSAPPRRKRSIEDIQDPGSKQATNIGANIDLVPTNVCRKCGSWKGELGSEPNVDLFLLHIVQVCREIRRVMRDDAVFFLNIGSTYSSTDTDSQIYRLRDDLSQRETQEVFDHLSKMWGAQEQIDKPMLELPESKSGKTRKISTVSMPKVCKAVSDVQVLETQVLQQDLCEIRQSDKEKSVPYSPMSNLSENVSTISGQCKKGETSQTFLQSGVLVQIQPEAEPHFVGRGRGRPDESRILCVEKTGVETRQENVSPLPQPKGFRGAPYPPVQEPQGGTLESKQWDNSMSEMPQKNEQQGIRESNAFISSCKYYPRYVEMNGPDIPTYIRKYFVPISRIKPQDDMLVPQRLAIELQKDGWFVRSDIIIAKNNPMPESVSGVRWEKHRIKVGNHGRGKESWRRETGQSDHIPDAIWKDCPGCAKCLPNDGLILRKGSWRPTSSHEHLLMLTKTADYYCDQQAVLEPAAYDGRKQTIMRGSEKYADGFVPSEPAQGMQVKGHEPWSKRIERDPDGNLIGPLDENGIPARNMRNVWVINNQPTTTQHYASFPDEIPRRAIAAGTSEKGVCPKCGAQWARVVKRENMVINKSGRYDELGDRGRTATSGTMVRPPKSETLSWKPTCKCNAGDPIPAIVLDCFAGTSTTLAVAKRMGRSYIGIELNPFYVEHISIPRLAEIDPLFSQEQNQEGESNA